MGRFFCAIIYQIWHFVQICVLYLCKATFFKKLLTFARTYVIIHTVIGKPVTITWQSEKGVKMDIMTDKQMEVILNLVADKFANCKNMEEVQQAIKDIKEMAKNNSPDK